MLKNIVIPTYLINHNAINKAQAYIWSAYTIPKGSRMEGYVNPSGLSVTVNVIYNAALIATFICRPLKH